MDPIRVIRGLFLEVLTKQMHLRGIGAGGTGESRSGGGGWTDSAYNEPFVRQLGLSLPRSSLIRLLQTSSAVVHRLTLNAYVQEKERFEEAEQPQEVRRNVMLVDAPAFLPIRGTLSCHVVILC